ncbi:MAG: hypothetical protein JJW01_01240 [Alphaproteobacteria bacterium]|nr:hypothetical protein [Rickettsiales bacterium]
MSVCCVSKILSGSDMRALCTFICYSGKKAMVLLLVFQLSGCGFVHNVAKLTRSNAVTYSLSELYIDNSEPSKTSILVKIVDIGCFKEKQLANVKLELIDIIKGMGYNIVDSISDANMIITLSFKNFSQISDKMLNSVEKYVHYKEITGSIVTSHDKMIPNDVKLAMAGNGVSVSSSSGNTAYSGTVGFFTRLLQRDFSSGLALGMLGSFLIAGSNPVTLILGAAVGAVITVLLQIITITKSYSGSVSIRISKRCEKYDVKRKFLTFESSNIIRESFLESKHDWVDYDSDLLIVVNSPLTMNRGRKLFTEQSINSIKSILSH